jgi:hypothetical protein
MQHSFLSDVYIIISDLNYNGGETAHVISRQSFYRRKRWDGRYLTQRCSESKYNEIKNQEWRKQYDKEIMKKYNVGEDYRQNRYFMEQVRPTLY